MKTYADRHDNTRRKRNRRGLLNHFREQIGELDMEELQQMVDAPTDYVNEIFNQHDLDHTNSGSHLICEDEFAEAENKVGKTAFVDLLEENVRAKLAESFEGSGFSEKDCPWLAHLFRHYRHRSAKYLEHSIHKYLPETKNAESVDEYIAPVQQKVVRAIAAWLKTGQITEVPEEIPRSLMRVAGQDAANQRARMGKGKALDGTTKSKMEGAMGTDLSDVKVHTDSEGSTFAQELDAQAATIGKDIAFASGQYRPGTLEGDALLAHELAHTLQQSDALESGEMGGADYEVMEKDAESATIGVMGKLFGGLRGMFGDVKANGWSRLKSGLQVQRCRKMEAESKELTIAQMDRKSFDQLEAEWRTKDTWLLNNYDFLDESGIADRVNYMLQLEEARNRKVNSLRNEVDHEEEVIYKKDNYNAGHPVGNKMRDAFIGMDDLWSQMTGTFLITNDLTDFDADTRVEVVYWSRWSENAIVKNSDGYIRKVWKNNLKPDTTDTGLIHYELNENAGTELEYRQNLIKETMYNRFDPQIIHWVNFYNDQFKLVSNRADPNVLKSMLFQESRFGTTGEHLLLPTYEKTQIDPLTGNWDDDVSNSSYIKSRYNLGQAIDDWQHQQYIMIEEMSPTDIFTDPLFKLDKIETELGKPVEEIDKDTLWRWNNFAIVRATDKFNTARNGSGQNLNATDSTVPSGNNLFEDYDFMIRVAARWWFEKFRSTITDDVPEGDWVLATKRYNGGGTEGYEGGGPASRIYMKQVYDRVENKANHKELSENKLYVDSDEANLLKIRSDFSGPEKPVIDRVKVSDFLEGDLNYRNANPTDINDEWVNKNGDSKSTVATDLKTKVDSAYHADIDLVFTENKPANNKKIRDAIDTLNKDAKEYVISKELNKLPWK